MDKEFQKKIDFDSDTFSDLKRDMNMVIQRLIGTMIERDTKEGSMTVKLDVNFIEEYIPNYDPETEGESRMVRKPQFKHKVTSAVKINDEKSGNLNSEMETVFDDESGCYVMQPIANTKQMTIFDSDFEAQKQAESQEEDNGPKAIEGGTQAALPGPSADDNVIDAEFKEVDGEPNVPDVSDDIIGDDMDYENPEEE